MPGRRKRGALLRRRSDRTLFAGALMLIALFTPWSVPVRSLRWPQIFGWQSPIAWIAIAALMVAFIPRFRRHAPLASVISGLALVGWFAWVSAHLFSASFRHSGFPFLPIDLVGEGWYIAALALVVAVDGLAVAASADERLARPAEVWPFAIVPGMGLVRLHYALRGRLWFVAVALAIFFLQTTAVGVEEFQYYASLGGLPPGRPRIGALIVAAVALLVWLLSLWDTRSRLRWEKSG